MSKLYVEFGSDPWNTFRFAQSLRHLPIRVASADQPRAGRLFPLSCAYIHFILITRHTCMEAGPLRGDQAVALDGRTVSSFFCFSPFFVSDFSFGCHV
jgi:hypothetical protein